MGLPLKKAFFLSGRVQLRFAPEVPASTIADGVLVFVFVYTLLLKGNNVLKFAYLFLYTKGQHF